MKKHLLGLFAIVLAVAFSAFTKPTETCTDTLYYFQYTGSNTDDCITAANALIFPATPSITTKAANPFTCTDAAVNVCAVGYTLSQLTPTSGGQYRLKTGVSPSAFVCCVKKSS